MKIPINIAKGEVEKEKENKDVIIGIDLGTTNSLVAYIQGEDPVAVKDANGSNTLVPSIIHFGEDEISVGNHAKDFLISEPQNTIYSVKRLMGKSYGDMSDNGRFLGYKIIDDPKDESSLVKVQVKDKFYTPVELSSFILKELKERIEKALGETVSKAVITVPAYFNDAQRQATRDAGKLANLDVLRIVNEPTAASLAYGIGLEEGEHKKIAVYDLGGGTFDISILEIQDGIFEVLSTNGDTYLGGDDFDHAIMDHWQSIYQISDEEIEVNKSLGQLLRVHAEKAKKSLSSETEYKVIVDGHEWKISRSEFEELIRPIVNRTIDSCKAAMKDAALEVSDIDSVIMVGGSTNVPLVQQEVSTFFGQEVNNSLNPDEVVALGAAIQADVLSGRRKNVLLLDVTPLSLGIETVGGLMDVIISRNSKVPSKAGRNYTTSVDGQANLRVSVYQGERDLVGDNRKLGDLFLRGIPPMPAGIPKIEVQFILDADGILTVKTMEHRSGIETQVELKSTYGISDEEMGRMLMESLQNAESDMKQRSLLEAINEANNILLSTDKFIKQNTTILTKKEVETLLSLSDNLRDAIKMEDKDQVRLNMEELNQYSTPLAHRAMDVNIANALKGKGVSE